MNMSWLLACLLVSFIYIYYIYTHILTCAHSHTPTSSNGPKAVCLRLLNLYFSQRLNSQLVPVSRLNYISKQHSKYNDMSVQIFFSCSLGKQVSFPFCTSKLKMKCYLYAFLNCSPSQSPFMLYIIIVINWHWCCFINKSFVAVKTGFYTKTRILPRYWFLCFSWMLIYYHI